MIKSSVENIGMVLGCNIVAESDYFGGVGSRCDVVKWGGRVEVLER